MDIPEIKNVMKNDYIDKKEAGISKSIRVLDVKE